MKQILVVDVPLLDDGRHLCNECPIWNKERLSCEYDFNMEAKGCPLKPMPKWTVNRNSVFSEKGGVIPDEWVYDFLKEILGETNEENISD